MSVERATTLQKLKALFVAGNIGLATYEEQVERALRGEVLESDGREVLQAWLEVDGLRVCRHFSQREPRIERLEYLVSVSEQGDTLWATYAPNADIPAVKGTA